MLNFSTVAKAKHAGDKLRLKSDVTLPENPDLPAETVRLENGSDLESKQ